MRYEITLKTLKFPSLDDLLKLSFLQKVLVYKKFELLKLFIFNNLKFLKVFILKVLAQEKKEMFAKWFGLKTFKGSAL